jgi:GDPmannose 4,6-dehydratase
VRALVTGITGQDGSYLAELLVAEGTEVVGLVKPPLERELPNLSAVRDRVRLVEGDVRDARALEATIRDTGPDEIYHLAAPTFVPASWDDPEGTLEAIAGGTATVLRAAEAVEARVVVPASPEIFGDSGVSPQDEEAPRRPVSPYGVAKLAAHELVRVVRDRHGLHASSVITYNHESPRRPERFVTRKVTRGAAAIALGRESELVLGDLDARRDWSHASDIVRGMVLAARADEPGDYVLAGGVARTVRELVETAFSAAGVDPEGHVSVDTSLVRPSEGTVMVGDASRARQALGWRPQVTFEELVREMVEADLERLQRQLTQP